MQPPSDDPRPFTLGPFTVERLIGRGAMASVWAAHHRDGTDVAIKVVDADLGRARRFRAAFAHEVRAVARLDHPAIVPVYDHGGLDARAAELSGLPPGAPYLVMQRLPGGPFEPRGWIALARGLEAVLDGLAHAHARGVVHRDLKPDNILGGALGPVITDFGLAFKPGSDLSDRASAGTPGYMAPEQIRGDWRSFGPATDLYAVGCIAWQAICGAPPHVMPGRPALAIAMAHVNQPLPSFVPKIPVPPRIAGWLTRMMARAPEDRFSFAAEALAALRAVIDDRPFTTPSLPGDWRVDARPPRPATLIGVGRALFGHRAWPPAGRESQRDRLWHLLDGTLTGGGPRAVVIDGPSGHGKSHLADWLAERAHRAGVAHTLRARHQPGGPDGGPGGGLGAMLARYLGGHAARGLARLRTLPALRDASAVEAVQLAALADPDGTCAEGDLEVRLDRSARRELWPTAFDALASAGPLVVVIDDAQWGPATLKVVEATLERATGRLLFVLTVRSDAVDRGSPIEARLAAFSARDDVEHMTLGPLDPAAHRRVVQAILPVSESLAETLVQRAAGSPLFAAELLRYFIGAGLLRDGPDGYLLAPHAAESLPRGLQAVWQARLVDALGAEAAGAWIPLEAAAALGLSVDGDEWRAVCERLGIALSRTGSERLLDARLLQADGRGWSFCHAMLRETLLAAARAEGRWAELNRSCADVLDARRAAALRVADHRIAGEQPEAALDPLREAARQALLDGEIDLLQRLQTDRVAILRRLRIRRRDPRWQSVRLHRARIDQREGRYGRSLRRAQQVERIALEDGDIEHQARALHAVANVQYYTVGPRLSVGSVAAVVPLARRLADSALLEYALSDFGSTLMFLGRVDEAEAALREAWSLVDPQQTPRRAGTVLYYLANTYAFRERTGPAIDYCRRARAEFARTGGTHTVALTWSVEGDLERRGGAIDRAARCYRRFAELCRTVGPAERAYLALNDALVALARGRNRRAHVRLDAAAAEDLSTQRAVVAGAHLACSAGLGDWLMWDATAHRLLGLVHDAPLSPDVPWAADIAAERAEAAGETQRAAFARRLAADHRSRLRGVAPARPESVT